MTVARTRFSAYWQGILEGARACNLGVAMLEEGFAARDGQSRVRWNRNSA
jgi:hypothetical protein